MRKKTSYETTNTTTVVNLTSYENVTVLENVRSRARNSNSTPDAVDASTADRLPASAMAHARRHNTPTQVTMTETVLQLENVTTTENVTYDG